MAKKKKQAGGNGNGNGGKPQLAMRKRNLLLGLSEAEQRVGGKHLTNSEKLTFEDFERVIPDSRGFLSVIARELGTTIATVKVFLKKFPTLQRMLDEENEKNLDISEGKLFEKIDKSDLTAIIFHLKCKGKERGYIEGYKAQPASHSVKINIVPAGLAISGKLKRGGRVKVIDIADAGAEPKQLEAPPVQGTEEEGQA